MSKIDKPLTDAIAEAEAYIKHLVSAGISSGVSYERGKLYALRAVRAALRGDPEHLKSFSVTSFRKG